MTGSVTIGVDRRAAIGLAAATLLAGGLSAEAPRGLARFPIWPGTAPGGDNVSVVEEEAPRQPGGPPETNLTTHVRTPTLTVIPAARSNGAALLILPGGGYRRVSIGREGYAIGRWFAERGVTCFCLLYRLPGDGWAAGPDAPLQDAQRALRLIRARAGHYAIDPKRVGALGFSAGGHLGARLATQSDNRTYTAVDAADAYSARPDLAGLLYPVITLAAPMAHAGSRQELLGANPSEERIRMWSAETSVTSGMPPTFIATAADDKTVPYDNSLLFHAALRAHSVPSELHIFETGAHGFGLEAAGATSLWPDMFLAWSRGHKLVP